MQEEVKRLQEEVQEEQVKARKLAEANDEIQDLKRRLKTFEDAQQSDKARIPELEVCTPYYGLRK